MTSLDTTDLWLLQNDPELADKSAEYLLNRKIRDTHCLGAEFFEETEQEPEEESQDQAASEAFFQFIEAQNWLSQDTKTLFLGLAGSQSLTQIGHALGGISKQAVHKRLKKQQDTAAYLLKIWQGKVNDPMPAGESIPCILDKNNQIAFDFVGGAQ